MKRKEVPPVSVFLIGAFLICLFGGLFLYQRVAPSGERADLNQVYDINGNQAALVINGELSPYKGVWTNNTVYLDLNTTKDLFNNGFYWDRESGCLLYTNAVTTYESVVGTNVYRTSEGSEEMMAGSIAYENDGTLYVSAGYVALFTDMDFAVYENPYRMVVSLGQTEQMRADVSKDTVLRRLGGIKSEVITEIPEGTTVTVLHGMDNWSGVCTEDGLVGYIQNKVLGETTPGRRESDFTEPEYTSISFDHKLTIVWHQVFEADANQEMATLMEQTQGVDVIAPTWFALQDDDGNFSSLADAAYVEEAHAMGLSVWVLINDFNQDMSVQQVLSRKSARTHLREGLVQAVKALGADGINIDFEYITQSCAGDFIQFLRELSVDCRREGLVLSVDNYMPTEGNAFYDMETQGKVADYVILMGYDEHWKGSQAGSNASISFVDRGVSTSLQMVPSSKLIGGIPFFTRVWTEIPEQQAAPGAQIREDDNSIYERYALTSEACGMERAAQMLEENGVTPQWDTQLGQMYGEYMTEQGRVRIWLEDVKSLEEKLKVIAQNELAGVAGWKLGLETGDVWPVIRQYNQ